MTQYICSKMFTDLNIKYPYNCIKNCCKSNDTVTSLDELNNENVLINNSEYLRRKHDMLFNNVLPKHGCDTCIITEPNSLFRSWNTWGHRLSEQNKHELYQTDNFTTYEFVLSSACDLKCVYCAPKDSSSWAKELGVPINEGNPVWEKRITEQLFNHLSKKQFDKNEYYFFFSGGEPTYNPKTIIMIEKILELVPLEKLKIIISTNANTKPSVFKKYTDLIKNKPNVKWVFDCSIDGIYDRCEAIRYGIKWDIATKNISELLTYDNVDVRISPTVNLYSIPTMKEFVEYFIKLFESYNKCRPYMFNFNMVQETDLTPMSMPAVYKEFLDKPIKICKEKNVNLYEHLLNVQQLIGTKIDNTTSKKIETKFNYFKQKRPDIDWDLLFPHVKDIIEELKRLNND